MMKHYNYVKLSSFSRPNEMLFSDKDFSKTCLLKILMFHSPKQNIFIMEIVAGSSERNLRHWGNYAFGLVFWLRHSDILFV